MNSGSTEFLRITATLNWCGNEQHQEGTLRRGQLARPNPWVQRVQLSRSCGCCGHYDRKYPLSLSDESKPRTTTCQALHRGVHGGAWRSESLATLTRFAPLCRLVSGRTLRGAHVPLWNDRCRG